MDKFSWKPVKMKDNENTCSESLYNKMECKKYIM